MKNAEQRLSHEKARPGEGGPFVYEELALLERRGSRGFAQALGLVLDIGRDLAEPGFVLAGVVSAEEELGAG
jgi:hypothetical protein